MEAEPAVVHNRLVQMVALACLCEEWYIGMVMAGLSVAVEFQPTGSNCVQDGRAVDHLHHDPQLLGLNNQISVCGLAGGLVGTE